MAKLIETQNFEFQLLEDASAPGKVVLEGVFQKAGVKNQNGRIYTDSLWERTLKDSSVMAKLIERRMVGMLEHPADGKSNLKEASHLVTGLWKEGCDIKGRIEVLSTPNGKILEALCRDGVKIGISSRASGSLRNTPEGAIVNENDFKLVSFDIVSDPSTPGAYPTVIHEDDNDMDLKENEMTAVEQYQKFEQRATKILNSTATDTASKELVESAAVALIAEIAASAKDSPELTELARPLFEDLAAKRKELKKVLTEATQGTIDTGIVRTMDQEPRPGPGEGWPINPGDPGPLAGVTNHVNPWMGGSGQAEEDANDVATVQEVEISEETKQDLMLNFATQVVDLPESKENNPLRALAAAYLLEHDTRQTEVSALERIITRMQSLYESAVKEGKIVVENADEKLQAKYSVALSMVEDLKNRYQKLSAKVYTEAALDELGLKDNEEARNFMAEAIEKDSSKKNVDEAIVSLKAIKGLKTKNPINESKEDKQLTEAVVKEVTKVESKVANLTESTAKAEADHIVRRLTQNMHSRSF